MDLIPPALHRCLLPFCLLGVLFFLGCSDPLPPAWLIAKDPPGKLRLLGVIAEPPEAAPGETVQLSALALTHPLYGVRRYNSKLGREIGTPEPPSLSYLWMVCTIPSGLSAPEACSLGAERDTVILGQGPTATLTLPPLASSERTRTLTVTLVLADGRTPLAKDAMTCLESNLQDPDHCIVAIKRVKVSLVQESQRNHNPRITSFALLGDELVLTRAADSAEPDLPEDPISMEGTEAPEEEVLVAAFFVTAGTLDTGRASFTDLAAKVKFTPPSPPFSTEDEKIVYFYGVLRDDRGGLSLETASVAVVQ